MVAGRLAEKNGYFYIVLSYNGPDGKRVQKWQGTGLPVKGNKKKADELLRQARRAFTPPVPNRSDDLSPDMLFSDYMLYWLEIIRSSVQPTTWSSYCFNVKDHIVPYFEPTGITLGGLQARHIQSFYLHERKSLKNTSVLKLHANLHKALKQAVKLDLIPGNPVDKVERPKLQKYMASYYTAQEMEELFQVARGSRLELIILFAAFYGLRRSEVLGLRWDAIDFEAGTLTIRHIVTTVSIDGKSKLVEADRAKTKSSLRTLPLVAAFAERLQALKAQQTYNRKLCGNCYNHRYDGYVFVDEMGNLIQPDRVSDGFARLLKAHGLRHIRFHDLRHTFATMALEHGMDVKTLSATIGHVSSATTLDIYSHITDTMQRQAAVHIDRKIGKTDAQMPTAQPSAVLLFLLSYIFSGAVTPSRSMPFFSTVRALAANFSRAASRWGSSPLMRQAL